MTSCADLATGTGPLPGRAGTLLAELGERAELHDLYDEHGSAVYHDITANDAHEVRDLVRLVRKASGPILELAAGSGRLTLPLLAVGRAVTALELAPGMLDVLHDRLAAAPARLRERCRTVRADMSRFALGQRFATIVLGTTSVSLLDAPGRAGLFTAVREHLAPGGRFLISTVDDALTGDGDGGTATGPDERVYALSGASGRAYRMHEYWPRGAPVRTVSVFPADPDTVPHGPVRIFASSIAILPADLLINEMAAAGLSLVARHPLSTGGTRHRDVLLEMEATA
ncbi:daptide-type RiPP biosynthesis methyltransferase [Streptomyces sp. NPDC029674]|uniref:daptide-type RiPP biosynthesis methyltransferase n=1 Tax=Streptomyces sp. NPDC029674 TaxID=3365297 RepID=UPI00384B6A2C